MKLADLVKTKANRVLGIDASTNSVAFCLMENDKPLKWGKINFVGQDIYEKIHDAKVKTSCMLDELKSDYIAVEGAILVRSPDAVIKLSYMRKQRTVDYFNNKYSLSVTDFDVADAFGIAHYANKVLTER